MGKGALISNTEQSIKLDPLPCMFGMQGGLPTSFNSADQSYSDSG